VVARRRRSPRGEGANVGAEILLAAEKLLIDTANAEAVSIRAVADAVGVTAPTIYRHFADKDALIHAVCSMGFQRFDAILQAAMAKATDPLDAILRCGDAYVRFGLDNPGHYRVLFMDAFEDHVPTSWDADDPGMNAFRGLVAVCQQCIDAGYSTIPDAIEMAVLIWSLVHGFVSLRIAKSALPWPDVGRQYEQLSRVLVNGISGTSS
jgi:AcrR family transcriptional regulator